MARLAEIKNASSKGVAPRTVHINPRHVITVEEVPGGTRITVDDGQIFHTTDVTAEIVGIIQQAML
jgi:hypothetical protein